VKVRYKIIDVTDVYDEKNTFGVTLNVRAKQANSQDILESEFATHALAGSVINFTIHLAGMTKHPWIKGNEFDVDFAPVFN
jgi:hypothetical protein